MGKVVIACTLALFLLLAGCSASDSDNSSSGSASKTGSTSGGKSTSGGTTSKPTSGGTTSGGTTGGTTSGSTTGPGGNDTLPNSTAGAEIFYLHSDGAEETMDHAPAADVEGGNGLAALAQTGYDKTFVAAEAAINAFPTGTPVEIHFQGFTITPDIDVVTSADLTAESGSVGAGDSAAMQSTSVALVSTPCTDWVVTFETTADIPAGAMLSLQIKVNSKVQFAPCFPGGETGPRLMFNPVAAA